jgi:hypothetical protein
MIAPKTDTELNGVGCCDLDIRTWWNPKDHLPNQGPTNPPETPAHWKKYGTQYPVNTSPGKNQNNHSFNPFLQSNPLAETPNPLNFPEGKQLPPGAMAPNPMDVIGQFQKECDITIVCHSQGCNITLSLIKKMCKN